MARHFSTAPDRSPYTQEHSNRRDLFRRVEGNLLSSGTLFGKARNSTTNPLLWQWRRSQKVLQGTQDFVGFYAAATYCFVTRRRTETSGTFVEDEKHEYYQVGARVPTSSTGSNERRSYFSHFQLVLGAYISGQSFVRLLFCTALNPENFPKFLSRQLQFEKGKSSLSHLLFSQQDFCLYGF
jgi:hypothetical protein